MNGFVYAHSVDYMGCMVCVFVRTGEYIEPSISREQAKTLLLKETLPTHISKLSNIYTLPTIHHIPYTIQAR
ncbi:hypothetical protein EON63_18170 [archaeon]|nr:MAG: hypothetical protein EON63_18170 [archaeon]